ncbi:RfaE bifunctional protein, domain protein, partial [mine drainage metagenome]
QKERRTPLFSSSEKKIHTLDTLLPALEKQRQAGRTIVFTNGCFDLLHAGHIEVLEEARSLGDFLVVAMNTD